MFRAFNARARFVMGTLVIWGGVWQVGTAASPVDVDPVALARTLSEPVLCDSRGSSYEVALHAVYAADVSADADWMAVSSKDQLAQRQRQVRERWIASFGGFPERTSLKARVTGVIPRNGYRIEKILFESQPGFYVTAHLCLPEASGGFKPPYPGLLICCGHHKDGKAAPAYQRALVLAAHAGIASLIYDPIEQGERLQWPADAAQKARYPMIYGHNTVGANALLLGWNFARFRIWDGMRALDYLQSRPEIDPSRLGVMGNSGGGTLSSYLMALDDRIGAGAPSCFLSTLHDVYFQSGPQDAEQTFFGQLTYGLTHAGFVLLRAPVPVCMSCARGDFFPFEGSLATFSTARTVFDRFGWSDRLAMLDMPGGHGWKEGARMGSVQWMRRWLADDAAALPLDIEALRVRTATYDEKQADCGLQGAEAWVTPTGQVRDLPGFRSVYDLLRDELAGVEKRRSPLTTREQRADAVRRTAGIRARDALRYRCAEVTRTRVDGCTVLKQALARSSGLILPTVTFLPEDADQTPVLVVSADGKSNTVETVSRYLKAGHPVMAADLTGVGEIVDNRFPFYNLKNQDESLSILFYALGQSLVGLRAEDLIICAETLAKTCGKPRVLLSAEGSLAIAGYHAYAAEPELFSAVESIHPPLSWTEVIRTNDRTRFADCVQNALRSYDWTDLYAP